MKVDKLVSVITINYNGLEDTCELMETLPLDDESVEVIVVDNASFKDEATIIEQRYPQVSVVRSQENLGFAGGNNLGIKAATGRYLFFINNDTLLPMASTFQQLINRLESSEAIGAVCPKIRFAWDDKPIQFAGYTPLSSITLRNQAIGCGEKDDGQYDTPNVTSFLHGAAMMVKREVVERVGVMPECYFLYYEEFDWSMMMRRAGYELWYEPAATIFHKESRATGQDSPLKTYYLTRNRLLFAQRNIKLPKRWLTYLYLLGPVAVRDFLRNLGCTRHPQLYASMTAYCDFLAGRFGKKQEKRQ